MQAQVQTPATDYIAEGYVKCAHIILGARIFQSEQQRPPPDRRSGRWFLLEIDELAGLTQRLEPWRRDVYAPLIIEVSIRPWDTSTVMPGDSSSPAAAQPAGASSGGAGAGSMLLERWTLCYAPGVSSSGNNNSRTAMDSAAVYKRLILLLRSLYSYVRVLPAYRMYRACKRHGGELFNTTYTLSTTADPSMQPLQHWPQQQQQQQMAGWPAAAGAAGGGNGSGGRMCQFAFTPVETLGGAFSIHVEYQPATTVHILEQTTIPVSMPRIIADYVDSPYARSAPSNAAAVPIKQGAAARAGSRLSGPDGPLALLQSSQLHHQPLVRHSWSSRDVSGTAVMQRGFSPSSASSSSHPGQQPQGQPYPRASSQGSVGPFSPTSPAAADAGVQSPVPGAAAGSSSWGRPPLPHGAGASSLHAAAHSHSTQGLAAAGAGYSSSLPSGYGGPMLGALPGSTGLPPASPGTPSGAARSPLFRSSSLSAAAAIGAAGPPPEGSAGGPAAAAGPRQQGQQGSSRLGTSPTLMQQLRQHQQYPRPPVQPLSPQSTQQGFHVKAAEPPAAGLSSSQQQQHAGCAPGSEGAPGAGDSSSKGSPAGRDVQEVGAAEAAAQPAGGHLSRASPEALGPHQEQQPLQLQLPGQAEGDSPPAAAEAAETATAQAEVAAGAAGGPSGSAEGGSSSADGGGSSSRLASAPVMIPSAAKVKGVRARSVSDLARLGEEAAAASAHQQQLEATEAGGGGEWLAHPQQQHDAAQAAGSTAGAEAALQPAAVRTKPMGGVAAGLSGMSGGFKSSSSSGLLKVHQQHLQQHGTARQQQQQLVQAPSSAPAAPRGMLGQLLSAGSGPTSPAFSPRGTAAHRGSGSSRGVVAAALAAAAASSSRDRQLYTGSHAHVAAGGDGRGEDTGADSDSSSSSSGTSSAAEGILSSTPTPRGAIIIRPNPLVHLQHGPLPAAAAGAAAPAVTSSSPGGSSSCGSQPNSLGSRALGRRAILGQMGQVGFPGPGSVGSGPGFGPFLPGAQPSTPGAPPSYLGSSPQLPFAFTPSAASLGTSLITLADAQRQLLPPGPGSSAARQQQPTAQLSRPGTAAAAAASAAAGIAAAGAAAGAEAVPAAGSAQGSVQAAAAADGAGLTPSAGTAGGGIAVGTPSPPLLYPPTTTASGGQVSFIRDISGLATIRRPSWSSRSSSFDIAAVGSATLPHHLSMSPGMADLMDPHLLLGYSSSHGSSAPGTRGAAGSSSSAAGAAAAPAVVYRWQQPGAGAGVLSPQAPQQQQGEGQGTQPQQPGDRGEPTGVDGSGCASDAVPPAGAAGATAAAGPGDGTQQGAGGESAAPSSGAAAVAAAAASVSASGSAGMCPEEVFGGSMGHDESESDLLPFVLDAEPTAAMQQLQQGQAHQALGAAAAGAGGYLAGPGAGSTVGTARRAGGAGGAAAAATGGSGVQKDVAVGAFLRLVQDAAGAPVGRLDRRQALWMQQQQQQQQQQQEEEGGSAGVPVLGEGLAPVCVGDAVNQVQELAVQLQQLLFPESCT